VVVAPFEAEVPDRPLEVSVRFGPLPEAAAVPPAKGLATEVVSQCQRRDDYRSMSREDYVPTDPWGVHRVGGTPL
jgi:hypothetical protein